MGSDPVTSGVVTCLHQPDGNVTGVTFFNQIGGDPRKRVLSPLHVWMAPAWQEEMQRAAQKSLAVMCPACSRSPDGLLALMGSANRGLITRAGSMSQ
jgi:hypothetical protein